MYITCIFNDLSIQNFVLFIQLQRDQQEANPLHRACTRKLARSKALGCNPIYFRIKSLLLISDPLLTASDKGNPKCKAAPNIPFGAASFWPAI